LAGSVCLAPRIFWSINLCYASSDDRILAISFQSFVALDQEENHSKKATQAQSLQGHQEESNACPIALFCVPSMLCPSFDIHDGSLFVSFLLIMAGLMSSMLVTSPWMAHVFSTKAPDAPPKTSDEYNDPKQFLPKRSKLAPGRRLLCLGLLAAIAMADSVPNIELQTDKTFKSGIRRHRGSHGFLMTANLKNESIEQLGVIVEASKVHLLRNDDYFELIMDTGCSKICTSHETILFLDC
jgi:hypothetical protein